MAFSSNITPDLLLQAYANGVFPMAENADDPEVFWLDPPMRGIFPLDQFHISKSLARRIRKRDYEIRFDHDFDQILSCCADRDETWINSTISGLYHQLFEQGFVHTCEIWQDGNLIGGVYGVTLGTAFFGESMFSRQTDGSKLALAHLVDHLNKQGFTLFDTQFVTDHLASLGAIEITKSEYHALLHAALQKRVTF